MHALSDPQVLEFRFLVVLHGPGLYAHAGEPLAASRWKRYEASPRLGVNVGDGHVGMLAYRVDRPGPDGSKGQQEPVRALGNSSLWWVIGRDPKWTTMDGRTMNYPAITTATANAITPVITSTTKHPPGLGSPLRISRPASDS